MLNAVCQEPQPGYLSRMSRSSRLRLVPVLASLPFVLVACALAPVVHGAKDEPSVATSPSAPTVAPWKGAPAPGDCFLVQEETRGDFYLASQVSHVECSVEHTLEIYAPTFYETAGKDDYADRCANGDEYGGSDLSREQVLWLKRLLVTAVVGKAELDGTVPISCAFEVVKRRDGDGFLYELVDGSLRGVFVSPDGIERIGMCARKSGGALNASDGEPCERGTEHWLLGVVANHRADLAFPGEAALREEASPKCLRYARKMTGSRLPDVYFSVSTKASWGNGQPLAMCAVKYDAVKL